MADKYQQSANAQMRKVDAAALEVWKLAGSKRIIKDRRRIRESG